MNKKFLACIFSFLLLTGTVLQAQVYKSAVKSTSQIKILCWNQDESLFAYGDSSEIVVCNADDYSVVGKILQKDAQYIRFFKEDGRENLLTFTSNGVIATWDVQNSLDNKQSLIQKKTNYAFNNIGTINQVSISKDSKYIAIVTNGNNLKICDRFVSMESEAMNVLSGHNAKIFFVGFSENSKYLISASEDGVVNVWNCQENTLFISMNGITSLNQIPLVLTNDQKVIWAKTASTFSVYGLVSNETSSINVGTTIVDIKYLAKKNQIAVLTKDDKIALYSLSTNKMVGYIPTVINSPVAQFEFNSKNTRLLVGLEDGSIYNFNLADVMLAPGQELPSFKNSQNDSNGSNKQKTKVFVDEPDPLKGKISQAVLENCVYFDLGVAGITSSDLFTTDIFLGAEYRHGQLFPPFYFGGGYEFAVGFPSSDFPFTYRVYGEKIDSPMVYMNTIYASGGFVTAPWKKDIFLILSARMGLRIISVAISATGAYSISTTKVAFYTNAGVGVIYKQFEGDLSCEYDVINGFCPKLSLGWNMNLSIFGKKN